MNANRMYPRKGTMKLCKVIAIAFAALVLTQPVASDAEKIVRPSSESEQQATTSESDLTSHGHYINKDKQVVHSPSRTITGKTPSGASAQCRDGSYSFSQHHSGTCSHHGGVARWLG
jgi:Protein of unknown function (DUF3761)